MRRWVAVLVVLLAACGGGSEASESKPDDPASLGEQLGCDTFEEQETKEFFVRELYTCGDDSKVYTFNTSTARDSWREIAEEFGVVVIDTGDRWIRVEA